MVLVVALLGLDGRTGFVQYLGSTPGKSTMKCKYWYHHFRYFDVLISIGPIVFKSNDFQWSKESKGFALCLFNQVLGFYLKCLK